MLVDFIVLAVAVALVIGLVVLRGKSGGKFDVKPTDAVIAATFVVLYLFMSGHISKLIIGSSGVTVETSQAILNASKADIKDGVFQVQLGAVDRAGKKADEIIAEVIADRAEAIEYVLGSNDYTATAIKDELIILTQHVFFKYVILSRDDNSLFGVLDAHKLVRILARQPGPHSWVDFAKHVNSGKPADLKLLKGIPSFVDGKLSVTPTDDKGEVLQKMQKSNLEWLPVVSEDNRFLGIISRSQLTANLLLDVMKRLSEEE